VSNGRFVKSSEQSVTGLLAEIRDEVKEFLQTRVLMLRSEMQEKFASLKPVIPLAAIATVLGLTAYLLLTLALVALVSVLLANSPYHWVLAFLIVGAVSLLAAVTTGMVAWSRLRKQKLAPQKTLQVLRADKIWIESEAKRPL
jgi:hypothetical protein